MTDDQQTRDTGNQTGAELRHRTRSGNRMILWLLLGVAGLFLAGAFGVALLVSYGPF